MTVSYRSTVQFLTWETEYGYDPISQSTVPIPIPPNVPIMSFIDVLLYMYTIQDPSQNIAFINICKVSLVSCNLEQFPMVNSLSVLSSVSQIFKN